MSHGTSSFYPVSMFALATALLLFTPCAAGQAPGPATKPAESATLTIDQGLSLKAAENPQISPDGSLVAYEVRETDWEENSYVKEIWVANTATGERYQLTRGKKTSHAARWSPDSKRLAYLSDRDGKDQIYLIFPSGGESGALTKFETGVSAFEWAPDGRRIAFIAEDPESKEQKDRKEKYGEYQIVKQDHTMSHLWMADVPADGAAKMPEPQRLTEGEQFSVTDLSWSPDSTRIAFTAQRDSEPASEGSADIFVLKLSDISVKKIVSTPGPDANPHWSPDGNSIAYETSNGAEFYFYTNSFLAVVPAAGGTPRVLTAAFDEDPSLLAWGPDGIYFAAQQKTAAHLFRLNPESKAIERCSKPDDLMLNSASFSRDFQQVAFEGALPNTFAEVFVAPVKTFAARPLTAMADQLKSFRLSTREVVSWKSTDGATIEGILIKPADFNPAKKYPLLVVIHGGPTGVSTPEFSISTAYPIEQFIAKGALVLRPNYRGSAGYGVKFRALNVRNLGVGDAWDVISGVDALIAKGLVDKDRVGSMGWSQGGYISAFLTTSSDRFKAISVGAGISDWTTYYVNTDITPFTPQYLHATPWDDPEIYRKTSPISYIKNAKTPTLIQHGSRDRRVPIPNAYELRQALEDRGVPVKMVAYQNFGHGINKPKQQRSLSEQNLEWFGRYIWGEK
jgi:dipeptidyl aminopeptidase/acylaminoacyl peptidase